MNKPVAWMNKETGVVCKEIYATKIPDDLIPLYTHPVKELTDEEIRELGRMSRKWQDPYVWLAKRINRPVKELTDEEIDELSKEVWERPWLEVHRKFAKAILRKAQEK